MEISKNKVSHSIVIAVVIADSNVFFFEELRNKPCRNACRYVELDILFLSCL